MTLFVNGWALISGLAMALWGAVGLALPQGSDLVHLHVFVGSLLPMLASPGAALATAADSDVPRDWRSQSRALWPAHIGLGVLSWSVGGWWFYLSSLGNHENFALVALMAFTVLHCVVFVATGLVFHLIPKTRPAGHQVWFGYAVLCICWILGGLSRL